MEQIKGKLEFISLFKPIMVGDIDLRDHLFNVFENLNGKRTKMNISMNGIEIVQDESSTQLVEYKKDDESLLMMLVNEDGSFGMSNIAAHLPDSLQRLNGMTVIASIYDDGFEIVHDSEEKVFGLYYTRNNSCKIPDNKVKSLCKIGKKDCCIFITASSEGFECVKFDSPTARMLLDRLSKGEMRASRIGNCKILGRKEE